MKLAASKETDKTSLLRATQVQYNSIEIKSDVKDDVVDNKDDKVDKGVKPIKYTCYCGVEMILYSKKDDKDDNDNNDNNQNTSQKNQERCTFCYDTYMDESAPFYYCDHPTKIAQEIAEIAAKKAAKDNKNSDKDSDKNKSVTKISRLRKISKDISKDISKSGLRKCWGDFQEFFVPQSKTQTKKSGNLTFCSECARLTYIGSSPQMKSKLCPYYVFITVLLILQITISEVLDDYLISLAVQWICVIIILIAIALFCFVGSKTAFLVYDPFDIIDGKSDGIYTAYQFFLLPILSIYLAFEWTVRPNNYPYCSMIDLHDADWGANSANYEDADYDCMRYYMFIGSAFLILSSLLLINIVGSRNVFTDILNFQRTALKDIVDEAAEHDMLNLIRQSIDDSKDVTFRKKSTWCSFSMLLSVLYPLVLTGLVHYDYWYLYVTNAGVLSWIYFVLLLCVSVGNWIWVTFIVLHNIPGEFARATYCTQALSLGTLFEKIDEVKDVNQWHEMRNHVYENEIPIIYHYFQPIMSFLVLSALFLTTLWCILFLFIAFCQIHVFWGILQTSEALMFLAFLTPFIFIASITVLLSMLEPYDQQKEHLKILRKTKLKLHHAECKYKDDEAKEEAEKAMALVNANNNNDNEEVKEPEHDKENGNGKEKNKEKKWKLDTETEKKEIEEEIDHLIEELVTDTAFATIVGVDLTKQKVNAIKGYIISGSTAILLGWMARVASNF